MPSPSQWNTIVRLRTSHMSTGGRDHRCEACSAAGSATGGGAAQRAPGPGSWSQSPTTIHRCYCILLLAGLCKRKGLAIMSL